MVEKLKTLISKFSNAKILCIGDVMLDIFVYGDVERISPEAPVPILKIKHEDTMLGGAGNVAVNIASLGAAPIFLSVIGKDDTGKDINNFLSSHSSIEHHLYENPSRRTSLKKRFISNHQQLLRTDKETVAPISAEAEAFIVKTTQKYAKECGAIILSDYGKGVLTNSCIEKIINIANDAGTPTIVDPKGNDFTKYRKATIVTPNKKELSIASNMPVNGDDNIVNAARHIMKTCKIEKILATRSEEGMSLIQGYTPDDIEHLQVRAKEVFDVSGAGDTVVSSLAVALASGATFSQAAYIANIAGGIVVDKIGTATTSAEEIIASLNAENEITENKPTNKCKRSPNSKLLSQEQALEKIAKMRRKGYKITFTNGCFDILHPGHIYSFEQAKQCEDKNILIIGLNTDTSVKRQGKGTERPINDEISRSTILSSLELVDIIILFDEDTPENLIKAIRPDVLVKGEDYKNNKVVGADFVKSYGGKLLLAKLLDGHSTTKTVKKLSNK
ncbi:MAG: D-glycero-beta-D-manno-heptose-7-phosphate kinase [Alphaproteobacteria bacterium]|nr:D-glycero-beta-D-manno-heptose-7-phosphate kinase [Alphaproteobacteria bacterium]